MTKTTIREIDRHECEDDDGEEYIVVELQHYSIFEPVSGPRREMPTIKELRLSNGEHVNWLSDDTFQIVANDKIIRKV